MSKHHYPNAKKYASQLRQGFTAISHRLKYQS